MARLALRLCKNIASAVRATPQWDACSAIN